MWLICFLIRKISDPLLKLKNLIKRCIYVFFLQCGIYGLFFIFSKFFRLSYPFLYISIVRPLIPMEYIKITGVLNLMKSFFLVSIVFSTIFFLFDTIKLFCERHLSFIPSDQKKNTFTMVLFSLLLIISYNMSQTQFLLSTSGPFLMWFLSILFWSFIWQNTYEESY